MSNNPNPDETVHTLHYIQKDHSELEDELAIFEAAFFGLVYEADFGGKSKVPTGAVNAYYKLKSSIFKVIGM